MKNTTVIFQIALVTCVVIALFAVMGFAKQSAPSEEPKQYIIVSGILANQGEEINAKLAEGWHLQGGVQVSNKWYYQAMSK